MEGTHPLQGGELKNQRADSTTKEVVKDLIEEFKRNQISRYMLLYVTFMLLYVT